MGESNSKRNYLSLSCKQLPFHIVFLSQRCKPRRSSDTSLPRMSTCIWMAVPGLGEPSEANTRDAWAGGRGGGRGFMREILDQSSGNDILTCIHGKHAHRDSKAHYRRGRDRNLAVRRRRCNLNLENMSCQKSRWFLTAFLQYMHDVFFFAFSFFLYFVQRDLIMWTNHPLLLLSKHASRGTNLVDESGFVRPRTPFSITEERSAAPEGEAG